MKLFYIQDNDRPAYIIAVDYNVAIVAWRRQINTENPDDEDEQRPSPDPQGIHMVADDQHLIICCERMGEDRRTFNALDPV